MERHRNDQPIAFYRRKASGHHAAQGLCKPDPTASLESENKLSGGVVIEGRGGDAIVLRRCR
jgi:hypothetical protein